MMECVGSGVNRVGCWGVELAWVGGWRVCDGTRLLHVCVHVSSIVCPNVYMYPFVSLYIVLVYVLVQGYSESYHVLYVQPRYDLVAYASDCIAFQ